MHSPVLGLEPSTAYSFYIQATGAEGSGVSDTVTLTTGALPSFLASSSFSSTTPARFGYILTALYDGSTAYATAFDSTGAVAWYRAFPGGKPAAEIKQQINGDITVMISASHGGEPVAGEADAVRPDGTIARVFTAPPSSFLDVHEMWEFFTQDGSYDGALFYAYTQRHLNLSSGGGPADTVVSGHQLIKQDAGARGVGSSMPGITSRAPTTSSRPRGSWTSITRMRSRSRRTATTSPRGAISM